MTDLTLTKTRLFEGVWEGVITRGSDSTAAPRIEVTHLNEHIDGVEISERPDGQGWILRVRVPVETISDGVQTFLINDADTGETIGDFALMSGEALGYDIRVEMDLLREELDLLKRAFRRHCLETL